MQVAAVDSHFNLNLLSHEMPVLPEGGAVIRVQGCGFCGSDLEKLTQQKAKAGMVLGHEIVGRIHELSPDAPFGWQVGDRLISAHHVPCGECHYCLNDSESMCRQFKTTNFEPGGFSQFLSLSKGHLEKTAIPISPDISDEEATCIEPLACVLRAVERSRGKIGHNPSVLIVGMGFIGLLAAQAYRNAGYTVLGSDLNPARLSLAEAQHFTTQTIAAQAPQDAWQAALSTLTSLSKVDTVFLTVVTPKTIETALQAVRDGGNIVVFASASTPTPIDPSILYFREINLISSYSPALRHLKEAAQAIEEKTIVTAPLVTHRLPLAEIQQAIALYKSGAAIKVFIDCQSSD